MRLQVSKMSVVVHVLVFCAATIHSWHSCANLKMLKLLVVFSLAHDCVLTAAQLVLVVVVELKAIIDVVPHELRLLTLLF